MPINYRTDSRNFFSLISESKTKGKIWPRSRLSVLLLRKVASPSLVPTLDRLRFAALVPAGLANVVAEAVAHVEVGLRLARALAEDLGLVAGPVAGQLLGLGSG